MIKSNKKDTNRPLKELYNFPNETRLGAKGWVILSKAVRREFVIKKHHRFILLYEDKGELKSDTIETKPLRSFVLARLRSECPYTPFRAYRIHIHVNSWWYVDLTTFMDKFNIPYPGTLTYSRFDEPFLKGIKFTVNEKNIS